MPARVSFPLLASAAVSIWLATACGSAAAQNDWQSPDPYFGVFQHRDAGTPEAERRYRAEIAPQQPHRLHAHGPAAQPAPRPRWIRPRSRGRATR
ncbi:MAG: hypothetical protein ACKO1M_11910 [Planctomycetota bacterium]